MIKLLSHPSLGFFASIPRTNAMTRPVSITAACTVSPIKRTGIYTANKQSIKQPLNTYFHVFVLLSDLLTLIESFFPSGRRIKKPLNIPTLIRIITTPNCCPVAFSSISALLENPIADATELDISDSYDKEPITDNLHQLHTVPRTDIKANSPTTIDKLGTIENTRLDLITFLSVSLVMPSSRQWL